MKRFRGENPSQTKWRRRWVAFSNYWPYRPMHKAGARQNRQRTAIVQANTIIHRALAARGMVPVPDFHIHWNKPPKPETQAAMAQVIEAAYKHFYR